MPSGQYKRSPEQIEALRKRAETMRSAIQHGDDCSCASCRGKRGEYDGEGNPRYGAKLSEATKKKISKSQKGKKVVITPEHAKKISESKKGKYTGEDHWNWKGGRKIARKRNLVLYGVRTSTKYKHWRKEILHEQFPNGIPKGIKTNVHHLKQLSIILKENDLTTVEDALACEAVWDKSNVVVITKGEHYIISMMERHKNISKGFVKSIKVWLALHEEIVRT